MFVEADPERKTHVTRGGKTHPRTARFAADADVPVAPTAAHFWLDHGTAYRLGE